MEIAVAFRSLSLYTNKGIIMTPQQYKLPSETIIYFKETSLFDFFLEISDYDADHHPKLSTDEYFLSVRGTFYQNFVCRPVQAVLDLLLEHEWDLTDTMFHINYTGKITGFLMAKRIDKIESLWLAELKGLDKL